MNTTKDLVIYWAKAYQNKTGENYIPTWGRDAKIFSDLLKHIDCDRIQGCIDVFFSKERKASSIPWFKATINDLLVEESHSKKPIPEKKALVNPDRVRFL